MTSELEDRYTDLRFSPYGTAFLTDAIIVQRYIEVDSRLLRVMAVVKVRASAHSNELREFSIDEDGIHIGEMLPDQEGLLGGRPTRRERPPAADSRTRGLILMPGTNRPSDEQKISIATRTLALLNQQADSVRAELLVLRKDLGRTQNDLSVVPSARLLEANEQLVLAALRAQAIADTARRRLGEVTRAALGAVLPGLSPSGELARADYHTRVADLLEANEQLMVAALSSQELEADAELAHPKQIKFLAMAAHELRNPLLPLRLAAQMLPRAASDAQLLAKLQATINGQLSHMARLIGDLLDGSRISTGKFRLERTTIDLSGVLELAIQTCQPVMEVRRHRFRRTGSSGPLTIHADAVRLVQVFSNLLENAAKYTPEEGLITLDAQVRDDAATIITISDNGIGITAQAMPHIFDLFTQDEHAAAHNQGGLGIGLAVVRELVEAHGGTVVAESAGTGQGSRFVVTLPLAAAGTATPARVGPNAAAT